MPRAFIFHCFSMISIICYAELSAGFGTKIMLSIALRVIHALTSGSVTSGSVTDCPGWFSGSGFDTINRAHNSRKYLLRLSFTQVSGNVP